MTFRNCVSVGYISHATMSEQKKTSADDDRAKRLMISAECLAVSKSTKLSLCSVLKALHRNGVLAGGLGSGTTNSIRKELRQAQEQHALSDTPYGKVVQSFDLPFKEFRKWDYCHPWAIMYHLSRICAAFSTMMSALENSVDSLNVILYIDEVVPGNVMRHDKGRTLQAIYWAIVEWPQWVLGRHESWIIFSVVQSEICSRFDGGILALIPYVLKTFWPQGNVSVKTVLINGVPIAFSYRFAGWIADLDAHAKSISSSKTVTATKACITCENITKFIDLESRPAGGLLRDLSCCEPSEFVRNTDASVFEKADQLHAAHQRGETPARLELMSTELGINYFPNSILFEPSMRCLYKPVTHYLRDWMHMLVSDGVAGTEMCLCIKECQKHVDIKFLHDYAMQFRLPRSKCSGAVPQEWFTKKSLGDHSMKHFASEILGMIVIFNAFLQDVMKEKQVMDLHITCFALLEELVSLLSLGADSAVQHVNRIQDLIYNHGVFFKALYGSDQCRPKFHHLYHVPDMIRWLNKLVSCFVLERKNKATKDAARECFRHIEHTVVVDLVNRLCVNAESNESSYRMQFLVDPCPTSVTSTLSAAAAVLHLGTVHVSDLVFLMDRSVAKVVRLWQDKSSLVAHVSACRRIESSLWEIDPGTDSRFIEASEIVAVLTYAIESPNVARIIVPVLYR